MPGGLQKPQSGDNGGREGVDKEAQELEAEHAGWEESLKTAGFYSESVTCLESTNINCKITNVPS